MTEEQSTIIGVDIGGTKIHAAAFGPDYSVIADVRASTVTGRAAGASNGETPVNTLLLADQVVDLIDGLRAKLGPRRLVAIGVGSPGIIDRVHGTIRAAVNLGIEAEPLELAKRISAAHAVACTVDNDVNIAALGARQLIDPQAPDLAYLSIGTGLAAGVILNGSLRRGRSGVAGEIGHFPVEPNGPLCECGLRGCLETLASGAAISRQWPTDQNTSPAASMFEAADNGSAEAMELRQQLGRHLAMAAYLLTVTYDIDRIVIGGGVAELGPALLVQIRDQLDKMGTESGFVASLAIGRRLSLCPPGAVGPVGAAVLAAEDLGWEAEK